MSDNKFYLSESIALYNIINKILFEADGTGRPIPFDVKYKLQRCRDMFSKDYSFFENERISLVKKYGEKDKENKVIKVPEASMQEFSDAMRKITEIQVSHNVRKLKPKDIDSIKITDITTNEMDIFMALLVEDDELIEDLKAPVVPEEKAPVDAE